MPVKVFIVSSVVCVLFVACGSVDGTRKQAEREREAGIQDYINRAESAQRNYGMENNQRQQELNRAVAERMAGSPHSGSSYRESTYKERVNTVKDKILRRSGGQPLCEIEHMQFLEDARSPKDILTQAKWMLEDSLKKEDIREKEYYKPGGVCSWAEKGMSARKKKEHREEMAREFNAKRAERKAALEAVIALMQEQPSGK